MLVGPAMGVAEKAQVEDCGRWCLRLFMFEGRYSSLGVVVCSVCMWGLVVVFV